MISKEEKKNIIRTYLRPFLSKPSSEIRELCKKELKNIDSFYVCSDRTTLSQVIVFELLSHGYQNWKYINSYDLVETFLGNDEENKEFLDRNTNLLVVYHSKSTMENKRLEDLLIHTVEYRNLESLMTIVLTEVELNKVRSVYQDIGKKVLEIGKTVSDDEI